MQQSQVQQSASAPQSHFIWQPILLVAVLGYLLAELYFLTAMVNTLDAGIRSSDFTFMEHMGRFISGAGVGLSVIIGLSLNSRMYKFTKAKRFAINVAVFSSCTLAGYFLVKGIYEFIEANTAKPVIHCSVLGNAAIRVLDRGELPGFAGYGKSSGSKSEFSRQLLRLYLPLNVCVDDGYRRELQQAQVIREELALMVEETRLPQRLAKPAVEMYKGFREQLPRFTDEIERLDRLNGQSERMFSLRAELIADLTLQLKSQSRFTRTDVDRIVAIYVCALDTAIARGHHSAYEQRFMLAVTDCLYDRARARFKTLPGVQRGADIYQLEQAIANDWARQFVLSPGDIPDKAFDLMRQSFALVFLPTYAVFISTFVVFMCIAAYFRTRFLIRAAKRKTRVNPVINAILSPLVVIPAIWTGIFLWVPEPDVEKTLFPPHTHTDWVRVMKVTIRPLLHYYQYTHSGFSEANLPLVLAPKISDGKSRLALRKERKRDKTLEQLKGYYVGEICNDQCQNVILDLKDGTADFAQIRYPLKQCENRLVFDKSNRADLRFYESTKNAKSCPTQGVWELQQTTDGIVVDIRNKTQNIQLTLSNLYI